MKIAHISDTHIRNLKYHYEYKMAAAGNGVRGGGRAGATNRRLVACQWVCLSAGGVVSSRRVVSNSWHATHQVRGVRPMGGDISGRHHCRHGLELLCL